MTVVAVVGDVATTTALALTTSWPRRPCAESDGSGPPAQAREPLLVEADPDGGSLAAWLGVPAAPSLSTLVTTARHEGEGVAWSLVEAHARRTPRGPTVVSAPVRAVEANRAVAEAVRTVFPVPSSAPCDVIVDAGRLRSPGPPAVASVADTVVLCHRQEHASTPAAGVRIGRLLDQAETIGGRPRLVLAVLGSVPYGAGEIAELVGDRIGQAIDHASLAVDPLAAAVLAGRAGVSARRLARLPLLRSTARLARLVAMPSVPTAEVGP